MPGVATVTLELLRSGEPHNQPLSPLTPYLAICGKEGPVDLTVPYEHQQMLLRLRALRYRNSQTSREMELDEVAKEMGKILAQVSSLMAKSLTGELVRAGGSECRLIHLRFIYSAAELALLPFELATAPSGFPGARQPLLLQSETPVCLTRGTRGAHMHAQDWHCAPRIVYAYASPAGVSPVPHKAHLRALREAVDPWISQYPDPAQEPASPTECGPDLSDQDTSVRLRRHRRESVKERITIIPNASLERIREACACRNPTIVHILAHGIQLERAGSRRFGLALHRGTKSAEMDVVDETRLAEAIRPYQHPSSKGLTFPSIVTIASCDSAGQGDVTGVGASLAHAIHEKGVPLVLASQFPLTKGGATRLARDVYREVLWGRDPRFVLSNARRHLKIHSAQNHDWASLVVYASFPEDLDVQLDRSAMARARESIETALNDADRLWANREFAERAEIQEGLEQFRSRLERAREHLGRLSADNIEVQGLLASTAKREAQILDKVDKRNRWSGEIDALLERACHHYGRALLLDRGASWPSVQKLALTAFLQKRKGQNTIELPLSRWTMAKECALLELQDEDRQTVAWGLGSLCELYALSPLVKPVPPDCSPPAALSATQQAQDFARRLVNEHRARDVELYSTKRQLLRYVEWFEIEATREAVQAALAEFPKNVFWK